MEGDNMAKPTGKPNGRPRKLSIINLLEDLSQIQCTQEEISQILIYLHGLFKKMKSFFVYIKKVLNLEECHSDVCNINPRVSLHDVI